MDRTTLEAFDSSVMDWILILETSAAICSVSLANHSGVMDEINADEPNAHSELVASFVKEIMDKNQISWDKIKAVAVSGGPGSYTGLRIGVSLAKGFCYARNIPLIAVNTLRSVAANVSPSSNQKICAMVDARRMDVYFAIFDKQLNVIQKDDFATITEDFLSNNQLCEGDIFVGSGAPKLTELFESKLHIQNPILTASKSYQEAWKKYKDRDFESVVYYEPNYIKAVHITQKKK